MIGNTQSNGWSITKLGEIADVAWGNTSITKASYANTGFAAYSAAGCDGFLPFYEHEGKAVIVSAIGARCGRCFLADGKWTAIKNTIVVKPERHLSDAEFVFYQLNSESLWPRSGSGQPFISIGQAKLVELRIPPLPEQKAIATALKAVQQAKETRQKELDLERERKAALMEHLFTYGTKGEPTKQTEIGEIPESWGVVKLGDVFYTQLGKMLSQKSKVGVEPSPYLRNANVQWGLVDCSDLYRMDFSKAERMKFDLLKGDLLVCEGGEIGRSAIWNEEVDECYFQKAIHRLRPISDRTNPRFYLYHMERAFRLRHLYGTAGASSTIAHLPQEKLKALIVPQPTIEEQDTIANLFERLDLRVHTTAREIGYLGEVFDALLDQFMTGQLSALPLLEEEYPEPEAVLS